MVKFLEKLLLPVAMGVFIRLVRKLLSPANALEMRERIRAYWWRVCVKSVYNGQSDSVADVIHQPIAVLFRFEHSPSEKEELARAKAAQ